jgi:DNA-binding response OmpR family regulator
MSRILVVDDHAHIRELLRINLQKRGYTVIALENYEQALRIMSEEHPDLLILDVMMPEGLMDGWEFLRSIREHPVWCDLPVIMLTALGMPRHRMIGTEILKADEYIVKPPDMGELLKIIKRLINETTGKRSTATH